MGASSEGGWEEDSRFMIEAISVLYKAGSSNVRRVIYAFAGRNTIAPVYKPDKVNWLGYAEIAECYLAGSDF